MVKGNNKKPLVSLGIIKSILATYLLKWMISDI